MTLSKTLRKQGYDLILGPIRSHQLGQLWHKQLLNKPEFYFEQLSDVFDSTVELKALQNDALTSQATQITELDIQSGMKFLQGTLQALGNTHVNLDANFGANMQFSYTEAQTLEYPTGAISNLLAASKLKVANPMLEEALNKRQLFVISGILYASGLRIKMDRRCELTPSATADFAKAKLEVVHNSASRLELISTSEKPVVIAVKANRIDFDKGKFADLTLFTDNRNVF